MAHRVCGPTNLAPNLELCTAAPQIQLGQVVFGEAGKAYRSVKFVDISTATYAVAKMTVMADNDAEEWNVTIDVSGGTAMAGLHPTGVTIAVPTASKPYGFVQIAGVADVVAGSAAIVAGDWLKPDTAEDGDMDEATVGTHGNIGAFALETIADDATGQAQLVGLL